MLDYFNSQPEKFWFFVGFALLAIEGIVLGFTSGFLLFAGIGGLLTGALLWSGLLPPTWIAGIASFGISSGLSAALLWKPFIKLQQRTEAPKHDLSSDLIGYAFQLNSRIDANTTGKTRYSGIEWRVEIDHEQGVISINAGERVTVSSVDAGIFRVKPVK